MDTFYTHYIRPTLEECPYEIHEDEGKVETAGYISTEKMVKRLIDAGARLAVANQGYEFEDVKSIPEDYTPLCALNDLDAMRLEKIVSQRLEAQAEAIKAAEAAVVPAVVAELPAAT